MLVHLMPAPQDCAASAKTCSGPISTSCFLEQARTVWDSKATRRRSRQLRAHSEPSPAQVVTAGGGGVNDKWTQMRAEKLGVPVQRAAQSEAAYGSALLAMRGEGLASASA